jgi:glutamate synthase domain-containing protein 2
MACLFFYLLEECLQRHVIAFGERECDARILRNPGFFHWRSGGEKHVNDPESIALIQEATKHENKSAYEKYCAAAMASIRYLIIAIKFKIPGCVFGLRIRMNHRWICSF